MSKLVLNTEAAERKRGCVFSENFDSAQAVVANGGTINGTPSNSNGATLNGTPDRLLYSNNVTKSWGSLFTCIVKFKTTNDATQTLADNTATDSSGFKIQLRSGGTIRVQIGNDVLSFRVITLTPSEDYFNGEWHTVSISQDGTNYYGKYDNDASSSASDGGYEIDNIMGLLVGVSNSSSSTSPSLNSYFTGTIKSVKTFDTCLTDQELEDYANNATYNYMNEAKGLWIGTSANNDPSNVRWLDASGNGNHAEYGDGSTPSTYPTKNAKLGYSFDSGDYFTVPQSPTINITDNLTTFWMGRISNINKAAMLAKRTAYNVKLCYSLTGFAGVVSFVVSQNGTSSFTVSAASNLTESPVVESITGTYEPSTALKVYRNGAIAGENTTSIPSSIYSTESNNLEVGAVNQGLPYFTGNESCVVGIWNKTLTPMQIIDLHLWAMRQVNKI